MNASLTRSKSLGSGSKSSLMTADASRPLQPTSTRGLGAPRTRAAQASHGGGKSFAISFATLGISPGVRMDFTTTLRLVRSRSACATVPTNWSRFSGPGSPASGSTWHTSLAEPRKGSGRGGPRPRSAHHDRRCHDCQLRYPANREQAGRRCKWITDLAAPRPSSAPPVRQRRPTAGRRRGETDQRVTRHSGRGTSDPAVRRLSGQRRQDRHVKTGHVTEANLWTSHPCGSSPTILSHLCSFMNE
jgi:hypothetical protein